ncbi:hypothetical protein CTAYLR_007761 [Chrysophaeum taylorii]|uniref:2Fe-2S ferredoxin-type domain-containing protein n=1 Tax=Chrysophaeum taylorii TaxID=2483200 RepID=A0AAD7XQ83_9STRA|nr:hypothetical protein CTAYLR_007761 [Chrysophaeum taylorii]
MCVVVATVTALSAPSEIRVRFVNTPDGKDVIAKASAGDILINVGDAAGVRVPRACRNGLCRSCLCDVVESTGPVTITACNTKLAQPENGGELVVDVYRMSSKEDKILASSMSRFSDGWEDEFVPDYKRNIRNGMGEDSVRRKDDFSKPDEWTTYEPLPSFASQARRNPVEQPREPFKAANDDDDDDEVTFLAAWSDDIFPDDPNVPDSDDFNSAIVAGLAPWERVW